MLKEQVFQGIGGPGGGWSESRSSTTPELVGITGLSPFGYFCGIFNLCHLNVFMANAFTFIMKEPEDTSSHSFTFFDPVLLISITLHWYAGFGR